MDFLDMIKTQQGDAVHVKMEVPEEGLQRRAEKMGRPTAAKSGAAAKTEVGATAVKEEVGATAAVKEEVGATAAVKAEVGATAAVKEEVGATAAVKEEVEPAAKRRKMASSSSSSSSSSAAAAAAVAAIEADGERKFQEAAAKARAYLHMRSVEAGNVKVMQEPDDQASHPDEDGMAEPVDN
jgi:hypothetical protein